MRGWRPEGRSRSSGGCGRFVVALVDDVGQCVNRAHDVLGGRADHRGVTLGPSGGVRVAAFDDCGRDARSDALPPERFNGFYPRGLHCRIDPG